MALFSARSVAWRWIATSYYGHRVPRRSDRPQRCYSLHIAYCSQGSKYLLSRVRKERGRVPFHRQFGITRRLHDAGLDYVLPAVARTNDGGDWVDGRNNHWFVREFIDHDRSPDWSSAPLIEDAAVRLAELHFHAGKLFAGDPSQSAAFTTAYDWSLRAVLDRQNAVLADMGRRHVAPQHVSTVQRRLSQLAVEYPDLDLGPIALSHLDYRPENILVRNARVAAIVDWDRAHFDHHLYDAAVGAMNIAYRQSPLDRRVTAIRFLDAYRDAVEAVYDESAVAWMLRFAATRNLAVSRTPDKWAALLAEVADTATSS